MFWWGEGVEGTGRNLSRPSLWWPNNNGKYPDSSFLSFNSPDHLPLVFGHQYGRSAPLLDLLVTSQLQAALRFAPSILSCYSWWQEICTLFWSSTCHQHVTEKWTSEGEMAWELTSNSKWSVKHTSLYDHLPSIIIYLLVWSDGQ